MSAQIFLWAILLVPALAVLAWLCLQIAVAYSTWRAFRDPHGRATAEIKCRKCKYDLRASPDICPECGTKPTKMQATFIRYLMRIDKLDQLESRRRSRGER